MKSALYIITLLLASVTALTCSNPLKESQPEKTKVRILVDDNLAPGRWVFYWDGKNENGDLQAPGKYLYAMETKDFDEVSYMTAEAGGKENTNNEEHYEAGTWFNYDLEESYPEPFKIRDGVNIPFLVKETARIKITIFKD